MRPRGIIPPIGTPLEPDERVDESGLRRLVSYLLDSGVHGIFVNGSMGGFALLTDREQLRAVEIVVDEVNGRVPVIAGASDTGSRRVIEKAKEVEKLGPDYLAILPPYYYRLTQESSIGFFREVAQTVQKPVFIYDNPTAIGFKLDLESIVKLGEEPNIIGIKTSDQDGNFWCQLISRFRCSEEFTVLIGTELLVPIALIMGADGIVGGLHNIAPRIAVEVYRAVQAGDYNRAFELGDRLAKLCQIFSYGEIWGGFEAALQYLGICEKATARPYRSLEPAERKRVEVILKEYLF